MLCSRRNRRCRPATLDFGSTLLGIQSSHSRSHTDLIPDRIWCLGKNTRSAGNSFLGIPSLILKTSNYYSGQAHTAILSLFGTLTDTRFPWLFLSTAPQRNPVHSLHAPATTSSPLPFLLDVAMAWILGFLVFSLEIILGDLFPWLFVSLLCSRSLPIFDLSPTFVLGLGRLWGVTVQRSGEAEHVLYLRDDVQDSCLGRACVLNYDPRSEFPSLVSNPPQRRGIRTCPLVEAPGVMPSFLASSPVLLTFVRTS